jgi:hypothetical protein
MTIPRRIKRPIRYKVLFLTIRSTYVVVRLDGNSTRGLTLTIAIDYALNHSDGGEGG